MSTRTYNFQSRPETGNKSHSRASATDRGHLHPLTGTTHDQGIIWELSPALSEETLAVLYSDIAVSRPSSPRKETHVEIAQGTGNCHLDSEIGGDNNNNNPMPKIIETTSSNEGDTPELDGDETPWTMVKHRLARSMSSLERARALSKKE